MKKAEIEKKIEDIKIEETEESRLQQLNIQNNFHISHIDLKALAHLQSQDKEMAESVLNIYKDEANHVKKMDIELLALEENEQKARIQEIPHHREIFKFGQKSAIGITLAGIVGGIIFGFLGMEAAATASIMVSGGSVAVQILGGKKENTK